ncbi:dTDP-4-dehydrorhamnose reductase [Paraglaciecola arctica]|uniref:dTDP-4-dehydrorhamnose reductase n=1 Tax=Paraglaciecola arctica TaxID=1128911 RepID=UPI001C07080D|nr:dTDP-4-dehydrorhamnose reductase [Paraglaciecola arctica]MBU3005729.1 dTDP-4-dehydrorhamnose reductase [Paraglaciecola arctica]
MSKTFKSILVTGGSGQVGYELCRALSAFGSILAPSRDELDLSDANAVDVYLAKHQPDLIVNPAAWTAVDAAETHQNEATRLNTALPAQLAKYADKHNAYLVHYSTDYVYAGTGDKPWLESDTPAPLSVYGQTKLAGDQAVVHHCKNHLIFRTSWVYADRGNNFLKTMLKLGEQRDSLNIVNDQFGAPTNARMIAQVTALAIYRKLLNQPIESGVYHLVNNGVTNWYGFAEAIFKQARLNNLPLKLDKLGGISTAEFPTPAARPANSRLNVSKLENALGIKLPNWQQQLEYTLNSYLK